MSENWNPDIAGAELESLFQLADEICSKDIYNEASGDNLEPDTTGSSSTTDNQSKDQLIMPVSTTHYAIAVMAYYLEQNCKDSAYDFMDGGLTLDIQSDVLAECRDSEEFQRLEQDYSAAGGCISCPDEDLWEVA